MPDGSKCAHVNFKCIRPLSDGSFFARIYPKLRDCRHSTNGLIIENVR